MKLKRSKLAIPLALVGWKFIVIKVIVRGYSMKFGSFENVENMFKQNNVEFEKIDGKSGLIFIEEEAGEEEVKITAEHINKLFMYENYNINNNDCDNEYDYYYNLKPKEAIDTNDRTKITVYNTQNFLKEFIHIKLKDEYAFYTKEKSGLLAV